MYIDSALNCPFTCAVKKELIQLHFERMSLQKKNVIQEFIKEDYVPSGNQFIVKYCIGKCLQNYLLKLLEVVQWYCSNFP